MVYSMMKQIPVTLLLAVKCIMTKQASVFKIDILCMWYVEAISCMYKIDSSMTKQVTHMHTTGSSCKLHVKQVSVYTRLITVVCSMTKQLFICARLIAVENSMMKQLPV